MPLRVLYVNPFAQSVSGPDESLLGLIGTLGQRVKPFVAIPPGNPHVKRYQACGTEVLVLPMQRIHRTINPFKMGQYGLMFVPDTLRFADLIRRYDIDLVHTNMEVVLQSGLAARLTGRPSVYHVRSTSFATPKIVCDALVTAVNALADEILVISKAVGNILWERGVQQKTTVVYNSLATLPFDQINQQTISGLRHELGASDGNQLVATVGRINPRKDLECFIKACALLSRRFDTARFAIVGDAAHDIERKYQEKLLQIADHAGIASKLVISPARFNIAELMSAFDVFVMTTVNEGFGRVVMEAMAARRPVVASNVGGIPELIENGVSGLLVPAGDPMAFADAIAGLLDDAEQRRQLGSRAREKIDSTFTHATQAPLVLAAYERAVARGRTKGSVRQDVSRKR